MKLLAPLACLLVLAPSAHAAPCTKGWKLEQGWLAPCDGDLVPALGLIDLLNQAKCNGPKADLKECKDARKVEQDTAQKAFDQEHTDRLACEHAKAPPTCPTPEPSNPTFTIVVVSVGVVAAFLAGFYLGAP